MDPLIGSALIGGASSLVSGLFGTFSQNANIDKQIAAQTAENQKTREYNLNLAKMQNQWNLEQWNRENEYNAPKAQMQRLADAGLNPDLFYQNGVSGMTAASSPSMTAGAPATPQDMSALGQKKTVGQAMQEGLQGAMLGAQVRLMNAQADKTEKEAEGQGLKNQNILALDKATLDKMLVDTDLSKEQKREVTQNIENLKKANTQLDYVISNLALQNQGLTQQQLFERLNFSLNHTKLHVEILNGMAQFGYTRAQTKSLLERLPKELALLTEQYYSARGSVDNLLGHFVESFENGETDGTFSGYLGGILGDTSSSFGKLVTKGVSESVDAVSWLIGTLAGNSLGVAVGRSVRNIRDGALRQGFRDAFPWAHRSRFGGASSSW